MHVVYTNVELTRSDVEVLRRALRRWQGALVVYLPPEPDGSKSEGYSILSNHADDLATRLDEAAERFRYQELADQGVTSAEIPF